MPSAELAAVVEMLRSIDWSAMTLDEQRAAIEASGGEPSADVIVDAVDADGVACEWVRTPHATANGRVVVALRGGGYCLGSLRSNRRLCELIAGLADVAVLNVGYRNAPEHPFPAALDDAVAAFRWLLSTGADPAAVAFVGASAGGGLALATLLALRDAGDTLPAAAVVISPWTDLANTGESIVTNAATEVMLDPAGIDATAAQYAGDVDPTNPYVSPLYGDLAGLAPLLLQASTTEILRDDSARFAARAAAAGVDVTLQLTPGMPHVWHAFAGLLPEADDALVELAVWLDQHLA